MQAKLSADIWKGNCVNRFSFFFGLFIPAVMLSAADHLLISEIVIQPSDGEYLVIYNPTEQNINLTNYYITDGTDVGQDKQYYKLPSGVDYWSGRSSDFIARFPAGLTLAASDKLVLSVRDSVRFHQTYGTNADLTLMDNMLSVDEVESTLGSSGLPKLTNSAETLILFYWDEISEEVQDVDYLLWGDTSHAIDKTGIGNYLDDTPIENQMFMPVHEMDEKLRRTSGEGNEIQSGGNGFTGHDETSENLNETWEVRPLISTKPEISQVTLTPENPTSEDPIVITAVVVDDESVLSVEAVTTFSGETTVSEMSLSEEDQYTIAFDPLETTGEFIYYIRAKDNLGLKDSTNVFSVHVTEPPMDMSIAYLLADLDNWVGQVIEIDGVVTIPAGKLRTNFTEAFLQDESERGIILYNSSLDTSFHRGDSVRVTAEVDEYNGKPELIYSNIDILKENTELPVVNLSIEEFNTLEYDYTFVKIWGKITERSDPSGSNTGANITIQDESGAQSTVRIWNSTGVLFDENFTLVNEALDSLLQVGSLIEVSGIGGSYSGASQIQPAYASDITEKLEGTPGDFNIYLKVEPYPFVPQLGENIGYEFSFPDDARIKLRVFDLSGRPITTLYDEYRGISFYITDTWNGKDEINRVVPPGVYIMHLDVTDTRTGKLSTDSAPVVIGVVGR